MFKFIVVSVLVNRFLGPVARMGEGRNAYRIVVPAANKKDHVGGLGICRWIVFGWVLKKCNI
jgi:hypothetical protein